MRYLVGRPLVLRDVSEELDVGVGQLGDGAHAAHAAARVWSAGSHLEKWQKFDSKDFRYIVNLDDIPAGLRGWGCLQPPGYGCKTRSGWWRHRPRPAGPWLDRWPPSPSSPRTREARQFGGPDGRGGGGETRHTLIAAHVAVLELLVSQAAKLASGPWSVHRLLIPAHL